MRDDFTVKTKDILAKRVGFRCSNPSCKKLTVGANADKGKTTLIGVAAHITAAASGGPRYDASLTSEQRASLDNGIWLCENCAALIDKDVQKFTIPLIQFWKSKAEDESFNELIKNYPQSIYEHKSPILEAEIIWTGTNRRALGLSYKNRDIYKDAIPISHAIWDYSIKWIYEIKIYNNSSVPAFNIEIIEDTNGARFQYFERVSKINNLQPYHDITLDAHIIADFTGMGKEVQEFEKPKFPDNIQGLRFLLTYHSENRSIYFTEVIVNDNELQNIISKDLPSHFID